VYRRITTRREREGLTASPALPLRAPLWGRWLLLIIRNTGAGAALVVRSRVRAGQAKGLVDLGCVSLPSARFATSIRSARISISNRSAASVTSGPSGPSTIIRR
jgi:hypothetical protein